jgi:peptide/nickel transport system substrate-binding protein
MWERYTASKHQMFLYWWDDAPEPDRYMYSLFHSASRPYYYKNPKADELLEKGRTIMDPKKRAEVYNDLDKVLYDDAPYLFLYVVPEVFAVANKVDYQGRRDGFLSMRYAKPKN